MNSYNLGGGKKIIPSFPSARPGIHNTTMRIRAPVDNGVDEPDNAQSKMAQPLSPVYNRRRSTGDSSDKSNLSIEQQQSDDIETEDEDNSTHADQSRTPKTSFNTSRNDFTPESHERSEKKSDDTSNSMVYCIFVLVLAVLAYYYFLNGQTNTNNIIYDQMKYNRDLKMLGEQYDVNDDSILKLQTGISTIFDKQDAGSFIFMYNSEDTRFDRTKFDEFMQAVATKSSKYLRNQSLPASHAVLDMSKIHAQSDTDIRELYKEDVQKSGIMLVKEIERVPSQAALAFHHYCDEFNPYVKKSAIFFTLDTVKCSTGKWTGIYDQIEQCLRKYWSAVPTDNIGPLLTRVVSTLIEVNK